MIRGPSQTLWHQSANRYHKEFPCQSTKNAHLTHQEKIKNDPSRQYSHWLLVFPKDVILENFIFSDDAIHVRTDSMDLVAKVKLSDPDSDDEEEDNDEKSEELVVDLLGQDVYWRIAVVGGERLKSPLRKKKKKGQRFGGAARSTGFVDAKQEEG